LQYLRAGQQQTTSRIEAINDRLTQTSGPKAINDSSAAEDQFIALSARLSALQNAMMRILRDNAELAGQLKATQAQMAQDNASVAEQLMRRLLNNLRPWRCSSPLSLWVPRSENAAG
jgi:hypothetical protein